MTNKSILVTGGAGFIGSNLCEYLLKRNYTIKCLDNLSTSKYENISTLVESYDNFSFIEGDIRNYDTCLTSLKDIHFVVNLAALGSVPRSIENPVASNSSNVTGFLNMIEAAKMKNIKGFIYASSSSVYGDNSNQIKHETKTGNVLSPYALTKSINEQYAKIYNDVFKFKSIGLRFFNIYGKNQDPNGPYAAVIPKFSQKILKGERPTINGDGSISRDFTHIDNVTELIHNIILKSDSLDFGIYNVGCGQSTTIKNLFELIRNKLSRYNSNLSQIEPIYGPDRVGDVSYSQASISLAEKFLDYKVSTDINKGLDEYLSWLVTDIK